MPLIRNGSWIFVASAPCCGATPSPTARPSFAATSAPTTAADRSSARKFSPAAKTNHYANFHFLRGKDNLNKSDTAPHEWFKKPGDQPPYTDDDLKERLLTWALLQPGEFPAMLAERTKLIHERALKLFGMSAGDFDALFATT